MEKDLKSSVQPHELQCAGGIPRKVYHEEMRHWEYLEKRKGVLPLWLLRSFVQCCEVTLKSEFQLKLIEDIQKGI